MSDVLDRSIAALSLVTNVSTGLSHPYDEARAKELFKALRAEGDSFTAAEIERVALRHKWPARHAKELGELGARIGAGGRVVIKHPREWGVPTVARLKAASGAGRRGR